MVVGRFQRCILFLTRLPNHVAITGYRDWHTVLADARGTLMANPAVEVRLQ
jgi:hypothetical protein